MVHQISFDEGACTSNSITVSPDGKRLAWVRDDGDDRTSGTLVTSSIDGTGQRTLAKQINCLGTHSLLWQGGDRLMAHRKSGEPLLFDLVAGKPVEGDLGRNAYSCWSADGTWLAGVADGKPYVTNGTKSRQYSYTPPQPEAEHWGGWEAQSVSLDGRYVSVGREGTDPPHRDDSFAVVDTATSKVVDLPGGGDIHSVLFTADNKVLVKRATGITVLGSDFKTLGAVAEPATVRDTKLLAYDPATPPGKPALRLGPDGLGALKLGMSKEEARASGMIKDIEGAGPAGEACPARAELTGEGGTVWFSTRLGVASIVPSSGVQTVDGIGVGSSRQSVVQSYPSWTPAAGDNARGVVPVPGNPDAVYRIAIKDDKVSSVALQYADQDCYE
ncbi:hypothetical protein QTQ03_19475 [Micromonospora sp. WMMA1363]|uniref:hypothetical protein n=1 Tax=Micromonospora sp. WMMA1363 TaxID=3053985 RepID=UPI00259CF43C|nr:hypothetical protein [Micromonospora sp. WMMA1363]MDM4721665.1 hypothetical protein [Micromonospora sp. WMMA1363]